MKIRVYLDDDNGVLTQVEDSIDAIAAEAAYRECLQEAMHLVHDCFNLEGPDKGEELIVQIANSLFEKIELHVVDDTSSS